MNRSVRTRRLLLVAGVAGLSSCDAGSERIDLAIVGATVFDGTGSQPLPDATILVGAGVIQAVGPSSSLRVGPNTEVVDAVGKFVIPGLTDSHVHFATGANVPADVERLLTQFLSYGVTAVLNLGATAGDVATIHRLQSLTAEDPRRGPEIYATGSLLTVAGSHPTSTIMRPPPSGDWRELGVWIVDTPEDVAAAVSEMAEAGMDGVKIVVESGPGVFGDDHPQMPPELIRAAVRSATSSALPVFAHATSSDELTDVLGAGVDAVVHLVADTKVGQMREVASSGTFLVPTLGLFIWADTWGDPEFNLNDPFLRAGVEPRVLEEARSNEALPKAAPTEEDWAWRRSIVRALALADSLGVEIVAGTDAGNSFVFPGYGMHWELELMVEAGLSPADALLAATSRPASMLGRAGEFGTVTPGARADLLILGGDPLADIRNTRTLERVVRRGLLLNPVSSSR